MKLSMLFFVLFFIGCSGKEYRLFEKENLEHMPQISEDLNISYQSRVVPNDILQIDIYNMNQKSNIMMQDSRYSGSVAIDDNSYMVYEDGTITLPLLNSVPVKGLTIKELNEDLTRRYRAFLNKPYIKASIKNHKVYVLGEVIKRGVIPIEGDTISVIEVLAKAGGLTDHAVRNRIRIISEDNGKYRLHTLNLNRFDTLNNNNLMLKHNSIVYVEPKNTKAIKVAINDYSPIMQAISTVLGTFLTIDYLNK
jgi:polysaccharide export outer membrane protein